MTTLTKNELLISGLFLILFLVLILLPSLDLSIISQVSSIRNSSFDSFMLLFSNISWGLVVFFVATAIFFYKKSKRKWIPPLWLSFVLSTAIILLLKILILRERPFMLFGLESVKEFAFWDSSFPSWSVAMAFAAFPTISKEFSSLKFLWVVFAILIAFFRIYFAYHFVSDIIAGALIGYFSGLIFLRLFEKKKMGE